MTTNDPVTPTPRDPRSRLKELLAIHEYDRTDAQWDEIVELEIQLAPGNRIGAPPIHQSPKPRHMPGQNRGGGQGGHGGPGPHSGGPGNPQNKPRKSKGPFKPKKKLPGQGGGQGGPGAGGVPGKEPPRDPS